MQEESKNTGKCGRRPARDKTNLERFRNFPDFDPCLILAEAAQYLGFDERETRRLVAEKEIACVRRATPGGRGHMKFRLSELNRYLKKNTIPAARSAS